MTIVKSPVHFLKKILILSLLLVFLYACTEQESSQKIIKTGICVLGGSEAGFTAAIQAARMGNKVAFIEPTGHPGGMLVEGIGKDIRFGSSVVIGGITREIYTAIENYYGRQPEFDKPGWSARYEPGVAEKIIKDFITREKNITFIGGTRIRESGGVRKEGSRIKSIYLEDGREIVADVFIDASIEGYLLKFAGVSLEWIREGNARYGETKNGIRGINNYRQFEVKVDPYIERGHPESGLIATIQAGELGEPGAPSKYIQGFCFRLCLTRDDSNKIPVTRPVNYNPADYEIYRRYLKAGGHLFKPEVNRPNGKTDLGSWHDLSANLYGENWMYPDGSYSVQDSVVEYHKKFTQGLIWFLQNDPAVDSVTRHEWSGWGLCRDEYTDNGGWPHRLYIRSGRRMVSDYVITEQLTRRKNTERVADPVAIAWWPTDAHHARRIVKDGYAYDEGFIFNDNDWRPFGISWRALIPKKTECSNVVTPTCLSSSYVGYGALRILPTFMILGQSAGCAAVLAAKNGTAIQDIDYAELKKVLVLSGQILEIPQDWLEIITSVN